MRRQFWGAFALPLVLIVAAPCSWAADPQEGDANRQALEHFALFDGCRPLGVIVRPVGAAARQIGASQEMLHAAAEGALRAAGLFEPLSYNQLGILLRVASDTFHLRVEYLKVLLDPASQYTGQAITWEAGTHGVHRNNINHVLAALHRQLDRFVQAYGRVNAEACNQAR